MIPRCVICGQFRTGPMARSLRGELNCLSHEVAARCAFCQSPAFDPADPGWRDLGGDRLRCPMCAAGAVDTAGDVRARLGGIRATLEDLGFALRTRVRVELSLVDELGAGSFGRAHPGAPLGTTELRVTGARTAEATRIRVLTGLPEVVFGRVVGHELGHAWLAQFGARPLVPAIEEGLCELIGYAWLKRAGTPFAEALREQIRVNPDTVYGNGFRTVHAAVRQHGMKTVVACLAAAGTLPG